MFAAMRHPLNKPTPNIMYRQRAPIMTPNNFATVRDVLRYAITRFNTEKLFFGHGSTNAFDEAAYLILHTLQLPLDQLEPFLDARLLQSEVDEVLRIIARRAEDRVPAAYITKEAYLGAYRFYVDERVIVPRSFIAELIPEQLAPWVQDPDAVHNILDLCTGSGCLPILLADAFPEAHIDAVDISKDALEVARINVKEYEMEDRITLHESDLYTNLPPRQYDLIISNPPYVNANSMSKLPEEYKQEPQLALAGGTDGMDLVRKIIAQAGSRLTPDGVLIIEIGNEREHAEAAFPDLELTWLSTSAGDHMVFMLRADQLR
jgi:ribosomal protein L3 glutamine methyltransferase